MTEPVVMTTTMKINGPMFDDETQISLGFAEAVNRGLQDLAQFEGANKVKEDLYPGHGRITGNLRSHIGASVTKDYVAQIDAGAALYGENLFYSMKIENRYGMFKKVYEDINNNPELYDQYIGDAIIEAFD